MHCATLRAALVRSSGFSREWIRFFRLKAELRTLEHSDAAEVQHSSDERPRCRWRRAGLALLLAPLVFLLSGCVYLRLLELKHQLADFDANFEIATDDGVRLTCRHPVLLTGDVRWLGVPPETARRIGQAEQWQIRWVKQLPPGVTESQQFDIAVNLTFVDDRLTRLAIPERYFAVMPKKFLIGVIRSLGGGHVDKTHFKIEADISAAEMAAARPRLPSIDKLLGRPSEEHVEGAATVARYRYVPATKESRAGVFDMALRFDTASGELLRWQGHTPMGNLAFNFGREPTAAPSPP
jgi:hypothetical protein